VSEFDQDPGAEEGVRVTDKRRIDPETGEVRPEAAATTPTPAEAPVEPEADPKVGELTADLQRVTAEYANYRKRVERDRQAVNDLAAAGVVNELLPILDDLGRAKEHGEYEGALKSMGDQLEAATAKLGLESFGAEGDPFDPTIHEAMTHSEAEDVEQPRVAMVFGVGYMFRGRVLRPARVGVEG
jgi:molecular chaperone GrpE